MIPEKNLHAIDFHVHVDERVKYENIPLMMRFRSLDGAGILAHNNLTFAKKVTKTFREKDKRKVYFAGVEVDTADGHIIAFGIDREIPTNLSSEETIDLIRSLGGVSIIPHPFMSHNSIGRKANTLKADGMEFCNGFAKIFFNFPNIMTEAAFKNKTFSRLGGSDAHYHQTIGSCFSWVEISDTLSEETILEAIRRKHTQPARRSIDIYDFYNFIKIIFTPKEGRSNIVRFMDYF